MSTCYHMGRVCCYRRQSHVLMLSFMGLGELQSCVVGDAAMRESPLLRYIGIAVVLVSCALSYQVPLGTGQNTFKCKPVVIVRAVESVTADCFGTILMSVLSSWSPHCDSTDKGMQFLIDGCQNTPSVAVTY